VSQHISDRDDDTRPPDARRTDQLLGNLPAGDNVALAEVVNPGIPHALLGAVGGGILGALTGQGAARGAMLGSLMGGMMGAMQGGALDPDPYCMPQSRRGRPVSAEDQFALEQERMMRAAQSVGRPQSQQRGGGVTVRIMGPNGGGVRVISLQELMNAMPGFSAAAMPQVDSSGERLVGPVTREALAALSDRVLTEDEITRLPDGQRECVICMGPFLAGQSVKWLECLHSYHSTCIDAALHVKSECPVCKHRVQIERASE
jgi:hypothetical protein